MAHRHKAKTEKIVGWSKCVAQPSQCCNGMAHGSVTIVEICECGATRSTESNGKRSLRGAWKD